jgi:hypothetical protein
VMAQPQRNPTTLNSVMEKPMSMTFRKPYQPDEKVAI